MVRGERALSSSPSSSPSPRRGASHEDSLLHLSLGVLHGSSSVLLTHSHESRKGPRSDLKEARSTSSPPGQLAQTALSRTPRPPVTQKQRDRKSLALRTPNKLKRKPAPPSLARPLSPSSASSSWAWPPRSPRRRRRSRPRRPSRSSRCRRPTTMPGSPRRLRAGGRGCGGGVSCGSRSRSTSRPRKRERRGRTLRLVVLIHGVRARPPRRLVLVDAHRVVVAVALHDGRAERLGLGRRELVHLVLDLDLLGLEEVGDVAQLLLGQGREDERRRGRRVLEPDREVERARRGERAADAAYANASEHQLRVARGASRRRRKTSARGRTERGRRPRSRRTRRASAASR